MRKTIPLDQLQVVGFERLESVAAETERAAHKARASLLTAVRQFLELNDCAGGEPVERIVDPPALVVEMKDEPKIEPNTAASAAPEA